MTSSVPVASKNKTIPISLRWFENEVVFSVDDRHSICLKYNPNEHILKFSSPSISKLSANSNGNNEFDFEQLLSILQPTSSNKCKRVFIEWCDMQCGQYLYYNLINILNVSKDISIDTNCFSSQKSTSDDSISNLPKFEAEFDESIDINDHLSSNDIIILAPIRSILRRFTNMGVFHDHILYLGPMPTVDFLRECKILLVFNCCMSANRKDVMNAKTNLPQMREKLFNICKWKMNTEYNYNLDEDNVTLDIGSDSNTNNNGGQGNIIKLQSMPFLDRMVFFYFVFLYILDCILVSLVL